jgi:hypothetical protein
MPVLIALGAYIMNGVIKALMQSKILLAILLAIYLFQQLASDLFAWLGDLLFVWIRDLCYLLFDPVVLVDAGFAILSIFLNVVSAMLPAEAGTRIATVAAWLESAPVTNCLSLGFFFISPVCSASTVLAVMRGVVGVWYLTSILRFSMFMKTQLPAGGSAN